MTAYFLKKSWIALFTLVSVVPSCIPVDDFAMPDRPTRKIDSQIDTPVVTETRQQIADRKRAQLEAKKTDQLRIKDQKKPELPKEEEKKVTQDLPPALPDNPVIKPKNHPVATSVPGKPGFVYSPFNNKVVDVKGIPSGTIVSDPQYPPSEKMHFRVP